MIQLLAKTSIILCFLKKYIYIYDVLTLPSFGKVGPVGNHVAGDIPVPWPVSQRCAEGLPEDVLKVIRVVGSHPAGVRQSNATQTVGLREQV